METTTGETLSLRKTWPLWAAVFALGIFMVFFRIGADANWYDESYSIAAARHPLARLIPMIGADSHPPLYFMALRGATHILGDSLAAVRSVSALGILGLALLGFFPMRRLFGERGGLAFSLIAFLTPMSIVSAHEARMYSLAAFLVTGMILFGYAAAKDGRKRDWALVSLFTLAAAYTHYYALIAAGAYWLVLLIRIIASRDRKALLSWLISAGIVVVLYAPWLFFLVAQASRVKKNYWIPPTNLEMVLKVLGYPFDRKFLGIPDPYKIGLFIAAIAAGVAGIVSLIRKNDDRWFIPASALAVYALTLLASLLLSVVFRPILMERYMIACMGALLLGIAAFAGSRKRKWAMPAILGLYLAANLATMIDVYRLEVNGAMDLVREDLKDEVRPEDVFIHGSEHNMGTFSYYFPENRHYLYIPEGFVPFSNYDVFSDRGSYGSDLGVFNERPVTIWATTRDGEYYPTPFSDIAEAPHRRQKGDLRWYTKAPGWYAVSVREYAYDPDKAEGAPVATAKPRGTMKVVVRGLKPKRGGSLLLGLFKEEPLVPDNVYRGAKEAAASETLELVFENVEYGEYALYGYHDADDDGTLDMKGVKPMEGIASSLRKPPEGDRPTFREMAFSFDGDERPVAIEVRYFD